MNGSAAWALAVGASLADAAQAAWRKRYVLVTLAALTAGGFAATRLLPPFGPSTSPANLPSTAPLPLVDASPAGNPAPQPGAPPGTSPHADPALSAWEAATACRASLAHARATAGATDCRVVAPSALTTVLVRMADPTATVPATVTDGMARLCRAVRDGDAGATDKLLLRSGADPKAVAVFTSGCTALLADTDRMFAEPPPAPSAVPSSENTESREPSFLDDAFGRAPR